MEKGNHGYKKGLWTAEEDQMLMDYVKIHGTGHWNSISKRTGLKRSGKSCRLRWMNYLNPGIKKGHFTEEEEDLIIRLHRLLGNRWSLIAGRIPGRTDNQIKNYWNTHLSKKLGIKKGTTKIVGGATSTDGDSNNPESSSPADSNKNSASSIFDQSPLDPDSHTQNLSCGVIGVSFEDSYGQNSDMEVHRQQATIMSSEGYITNSSFWVSEYDGLMSGSGTNPGCFMELLDGNCFNLDWNHL